MTQGTITKVAGPLVIAEGMRSANMFDVVRVSDKHLIGEIIEMHGDKASVQVYEETAGLGPGEKVVSTGRSDFPNQINNVLAFPGIFRGAFDVRAKDINEEMKMAAAQALADLISDEELNEDYIIPKAFDPRVGKAVAAAVAKAAKESGVARI